MQHAWRRSGGVALSGLLPWMITGLAIAVAMTGWIGPPPAPAPSQPAARDPLVGTRPLRIALERSNAENLALRRELDRLLADRERRNGGNDLEPKDVDDTRRQEQLGNLADLKSKLREQLALADAGDEEAARNAANLMVQILGAGPDSFPALRDLYLEASGSEARLRIMPLLLFTGSDEAAGFFASELDKETDPELRRMMFTAVADTAGPQAILTMKDSFLRALTSDDDPVTRAAAIRGLRLSSGPEVDEAILQAAADPSEEVRLAVIAHLAASGFDLERLRSVVSGDASARVRKVGDCRLLIAESEE